MWAQAGGNLQGVSLIRHGNRGQNRASGSPVWGWYGTGTQWGKVVPTPEPQHSVTVRVSKQKILKKELTAGPGWVQETDFSEGHKLGRARPQGLGGQV